ncbi:hypothetical protein BDN67DRAFT_973718 [Paxillus ammoniavirescens]|nr:hypothetical protein BDN67DRAFT_973718 [Paxillus ammoniavirescens]
MALNINLLSSRTQKDPGFRIHRAKVEPCRSRSVCARRVSCSTGLLHDHYQTNPPRGKSEKLRIIMWPCRRRMAAMARNENDAVLHWQAPCPTGTLCIADSPEVTPGPIPPHGKKSRNTNRPAWRTLRKTFGLPSVGRNCKTTGEYGASLHLVIGGS